MGPITHRPPHGTLEHWAAGVGTGQPLRHPRKAATQAARLLSIVAAHCTRQLISAGLPAALQPWTHSIPAANAAVKQVFAVALHPATHGAAVPAGIPGHVVMQSVRLVLQVPRAVRIAVRHPARQCVSPAAQPCQHAIRAVRACIAQTPRPRAQLFAHC